MPFDANGNASVTRTIAVTGQTVQAAQVNVPFADIQSMLSSTMLRTGAGQATSNINFGGFKAVNLADGTAPTDAATKGQLDAVAPPGYVFGLASAPNGSSPSNNIDVAPGVASTSVSPYSLIALVSAITKNTANLWAVGANQGSLDTGSVADGKYYIYLIQRSDTGGVDVLTSLSANAPVVPSPYDRVSVPVLFFYRVSGVNRPNSFWQVLGNGYVKIAEQTAANSANLTFVNVLSPAFDLYMIEFDEVAPSVVATLQMAMSTDAGVSWLSTGYNYSGVISGPGGTPPTVQVLNATNFLVGLQTVSPTGGGVSSNMALHRTASARRWEANVSLTDSSGTDMRQQSLAGQLRQNADSIRFQQGSGNIASGTIRIYGLRK